MTTVINSREELLQALEYHRYSDTASLTSEFGENATDVANWDVSAVTDFSYVFSNSVFTGPNGTGGDNTYFNEDISGWDVSNATNMADMFGSNDVFDQDLSGWDVSKVTNMASMFAGAIKFNADLSNWNVSNVTNMRVMFWNATDFDGDVSSWDVSNVTDMTQMFGSATGLPPVAFDINKVDAWNTNNAVTYTFTSESQLSNAIDAYIFSKNIHTYGTINNWDVSGITNMDNLFKNGRAKNGGGTLDTTSFNSDISSWNVASVTSMIDMFNGATSFDINFVDSWNTNSVSTYTFTSENELTSAVDSYISSKDINTYGTINNWNVGSITNIDNLFKNGRSKNSGGTLDTTSFNSDISNWNTSSVTSMNNAFDGASTFNQDLSGWNVSSVTIMDSMFKDASTFNQDLSGWNVTSGTSRINLFEGATSMLVIKMPVYILVNKNDLLTALDQHIDGDFSVYGEISRWDFTNVTDFSDILKNGRSKNSGGTFNSTSFNSDISSWNVSGVTNMNNAFDGASTFNQDISGWDVSSVTSMDSMFKDASSFNQDLSGWNVTVGTSRNNLFQGATNMDVENKPVYILVDRNDLLTALEQYIDGDSSTYGLISTWNVERVSNFSEILKNGRNRVGSSGILDTTTFNGDISGWDVSNVTIMTEMFKGASTFNKDISGWDVSGVINMSEMFSDATSFNQDLSNWNVTYVVNMYRMFYFARAFVQDLSSWNTVSVTNMTEIFYGAGYAVGESYPSKISQNYNWNTSNLSLGGANVFTDAGSLVTAVINYIALNQIDVYGNIANWDVSGVSSMYRLFQDGKTSYFDTKTFNADLSRWDVSSVTNMTEMFDGASDFNSDISGWNVGNVKYMTNMFDGTTDFNQNLDNWNTSNLLNKTTIGIGTSGRNTLLQAAEMYILEPYKSLETYGSISNWRVSFVTDFSDLFKNGRDRLIASGTIDTTNFNGNISGWDVSNATNMESMFNGASSFDQDISGWDVSGVTSMANMFNGTTAFSNKLANWDLSSLNVSDIPTSKADLLSVITEYTGGYSSENWRYLNTKFSYGLLTNWDVSGVTNMDSLFKKYVYDVTSSPSELTTISGVWQDSVQSTSGTKLAAVAYGGYIYTSSDSGTTWTERTGSGSRNWYSITGSSDGTKLAAVAYGGYIYTSSDSGATWTERTSSGSRNWYSITGSSDGTKLAAVVNDGYIYTSSDSGATWTVRTGAGSRNWQSITSSSDGTTLFVVNYGNPLVNSGADNSFIYKSTDSGVNWSYLLTISYGYTSVSTTSDGSTVAVSRFGNSPSVYVSKNSGSSWTSHLTNSDVSGSVSDITRVSIADNGTLIAVRGYDSAGDTGGDIYISEDTGTVWKTFTTGKFFNTRLSKDGTKIWTSKYNGKIWTFSSVDSEIDNVFIPDSYTLTERNSISGVWRDFDSSTDGTKLVAIGNNSTTNYVYIYTSSDSGVTWTERTLAGSRNWRSIASSSDGTKIVGVVYGGSIYTSSDSGSTWTERTGAGTTRNWQSVTMSGDGTHITAVVYTGSIYTSTNSGATWIEAELDGNEMTYEWLGIASADQFYSADGNVINRAIMYAITKNTSYETLGSPSGIYVSVETEPSITLIGIGEEYTNATNVSTTGGTGTGLTVDITTNNSGNVIRVDINNPGNGYIYNDELTITGGDGYAKVEFTGYAAGQEWEKWRLLRDSDAYFSDVAISASGNRVVASISDGEKTNPQRRGIYTIVNNVEYPDRLLANKHILDLAYVSVSSDGTKIITTTKYDTTTGTGGIIYVSEDSGDNWLQITNTGNMYNTQYTGNDSIITSEYNGKINNITKVATANDSIISWNVSNVSSMNNMFDGLVNFNQDISSSSSRNWYSITGSSDGTKLAAAVNGGFIYTSSDSGATWTERTGSGIRNWYSITGSSDGTKLAAVVTYNGYIYTSSDSGTNWTRRTGAGRRNWYSITSSSDGTKLAAVTYGGYIYTSSDSGATWSDSRNWQSITGSSDGTKLAAVVNGGYIYTSSDSGATWTVRTGAGSRNWQSITSSSNGTKLAAVVNGGYIYTSSDSGATWTVRTGAGSRNWQSITGSSDGTKLAAIAYSGYIYTSSDSGATWTERTGSGARNWQSIIGSSDGTELAAVVNDGYIYTSSDSGATWTERTGAGNRIWYSITVSSDGTKLAAVVNDGYIYTSSDSGATWTRRTGSGSRNWQSITGSSDGTELTAVVNDGYIYTSSDSGATWTERTGAGSRNWYSITGSSDGTKLATVTYGGYIYTSSDSGTSWTRRTGSSSRNWQSITSSSDGTKLAVVSDGYIYTSSDSGATWAERTGAGIRNWQSITGSSDGTKLAVVNDGYIYTSSDSGATWTERTGSGNRNWQSITGSSDGTKLAAVVNGGYIYTSSDSGATWTRRTGSGSRNWQSITGSSDGTELTAVVNDGYIYTSSDSGDTWTERATWNVDNVTSMNSIFKGATSFNQDISSWNVSNVKNMSSIFNGATSFNQNISAWDVSDVTSMNSIFNGATSFNQNINAWDVSNVNNMNSIFRNTSSFNQNISAWDVSNVTSMNSMFNGATSFNQDIFAWNVSNVTIMNSMFKSANSFNKDISNWNLNGISTENMFNGAVSFNQDISSWKTTSDIPTMMHGSGVASTARYPGKIFSNNSALTTAVNEWFSDNSTTEQNYGKLSSWGTVNITNTSELFKNGRTITGESVLDSTTFNEDISAWDVSGVTDMKSMFSGCAAFNADLSSWTVNSVTDMENMFNGCTVFDRDLSGWNTSATVTGSGSSWSHKRNDMFLNCPDMVNNYHQIPVFTFPDGSRSLYAIAHDNWQKSTTHNYASENTVSDLYKTISRSSKYFQRKNEVIATYGHITDWVVNISQSDFDDYVVSNRYPYVHLDDYLGGNQIVDFMLDTANTKRNYRERTKVVWVLTTQAEPSGPYTFSDRNALLTAIDQVSTGETTSASMADWNVGNITDMSQLFKHRRAKNGGGTLDTTAIDFSYILNWNTRNVTDMSEMFFGCTTFNDFLYNWDTRNVTSMYSMFQGCTSLTGRGPNPASSGSNTEAKYGTELTSMTSPFSSSDSLENKVYGTTFGFYVNRVYNYNSFTRKYIWNTRKVKDMRNMFKGCSSFRPAYRFTSTSQSRITGHDLAFWDTGSVTNMRNMFEGCTVFGVPEYLPDNTAIFTPLVWNISKVTLMDEMFKDANVFNNSITHWNWNMTTGVTDFITGNNELGNDNNNTKISEIQSPITSTFTVLDQLKLAVDYVLTSNTLSSILKYSDISTWDVSGMTELNSLFKNGRTKAAGGGTISTTSFNSDISGWDTSNVTDMNSTFDGASAFNVDISGWDTSNVTDMRYLFQNASTFSQSLSSWTIDSIEIAEFDGFLSMFSGATQITGAGIPSSPTKNNWSTYSWPGGSGSGSGSGSGPVTVTFTVSVNSGAISLSSETSGDGPDAPYSLGGSNLTLINCNTYIFDFSGVSGHSGFSFATGMYPITDYSYTSGSATSDNVTITDGSSQFTLVANVSSEVSLFFYCTEHETSETWINISIPTGGPHNCSGSGGSGGSGSGITSKTDLETAVFAWINDSTSATETYGNITGWDVSSVTDFSGLFYGETSFNENLSSWSVNQVTNMNDMFYGATSFEQDLSNWNIASSTSLKRIFAGATKMLNRGLSSTMIASKWSDDFAVYSTYDSFNGLFDSNGASKNSNYMEVSNNKVTFKQDYTSEFRNSTSLSGSDLNFAMIKSTLSRYNSDLFSKTVIFDKAALENFTSFGKKEVAILNANSDGGDYGSQTTVYDINGVRTGIYVLLVEENDTITIQTNTADYQITFTKNASDYSITTEDSTSTTTTVSEGYSGSFDGFSYTIGSISGEGNNNTFTTAEHSSIFTNFSVSDGATYVQSISIDVDLNSFIDAYETIYTSWPISGTRTITIKPLVYDGDWIAFDNINGETYTNVNDGDPGNTKSITFTGPGDGLSYQKDGSTTYIDPSVGKSVGFRITTTIDDTINGGTVDYTFTSSTESAAFACFYGDVEITTQQGAKKIADLSRGDLIMTNAGFQPLARLLKSVKPKETGRYVDYIINIPKDYFKKGVPTKDILVSNPHPISVKKIYNGHEHEYVHLIAKELTVLDGIDYIHDDEEYIYNLLFDQQYEVDVSGIKFLSHHPNHNNGNIRLKNGEEIAQKRRSEMVYADKSGIKFQIAKLDDLLQNLPEDTNIREFLADIISFE